MNSHNRKKTFVPIEVPVEVKGNWSRESSIAVCTQVLQYLLYQRRQIPLQVPELQRQSQTSLHLSSLPTHVDATAHNPLLQDSTTAMIIQNNVWYNIECSLCLVI